MLHHNLDVMHIEKNVVNNIISILLNLDDKTNDKWKTHQDLKGYGYKK